MSESSISQTQKNYLSDLLDIYKKEPILDYIQYCLKELDEQQKNKKTDEMQNQDKQGVCLNVVGIKIYFKKKENGIYSPYFTDACKIDFSTFDNHRLYEDLELHKYMFKVFSKYNYSPIINKICNNTKESHENLLKETFVWDTYISNDLCCNMSYDMNKFKNKIIRNYISFINQYLLHIFSIPKVSECLNILNKKVEFKIHNFNNKNKNEKDNEIYLDIEKEFKSNGCSFIFLIELKRLYDCLILSSNYFKYNFENCLLFEIEKLTKNLFFKYVIENEVVSSLIYQIKLIFSLKKNSNNEILNLINKFTINLRAEIEKENYLIKIFNEIYKNDSSKFPEKEKFNFKEIKFLEKDYELNGNEIKYKEDEKIKEINDIDELTKYIQGEGVENKKKKKKKKRKENPINILSKINYNENKLDDDLTSIYSHDTIFSNFKKDIQNDMIEGNNFVKNKPILSDKFLEGSKK